jgi:hypothetical protein
MSKVAETDEPSERRASAYGWLVLIAILAFLPLVILAGLVHIAWLTMAQVLCWFRASPYVVLVYSDSPKWKLHIEQQVLPKLPPGSSTLNWSQRGTWSRWSLSAHMFRLYAGRREYCPIALVFRRGHWVKTFRFFAPFHAASKGNDAPLKKTEAAFLQACGNGS